MPPAASLEAHKPMLDIWQQALDSPQGIRVRSPNPVDLRARLYHARAAERRNNAKVFPEDNVMHGKSYYDNFIIKLEPDALRIIPSNALTIEGVDLL